MKELRARVKAALERMEAANKALTEAGEDADFDALNAEFDAAEEEHRTAAAALERRRKVEEARTNLPVDPTDDNPVDPDKPEGDDPEVPEGDPDLTAEERTILAAGRMHRSRTRSRSPRVRINREPLTYERHNGSNFFLDAYRAKNGDQAAAARMSQHEREMSVELRAHPSQAAGEGGDFIAPLFLMDEWISVPRAGRAIADSLNPKPMPKTNTIEVPAVATGSTTEEQTDGGTVSSTDVTTGMVVAKAKTIAGQQDASMQLHELSQPGIEDIIFDDLTRSYDQTLDRAVISGTQTNAKGLLQVANSNAITFTQATPTLPLLYPKVAAGIAEVDTKLFRPASIIAMHPRRWGFALASQDTQGRPLIVPTAPSNPAAIFDQVASEGFVGEMQGLPVIKDANIPTNEGTGTNQDAILIYRAEDIYLWETEIPRLRVLEEVLSGTLQVRYQLYGYYILMANRYPQAISKIQGTGLATPTF